MSYCGPKGIEYDAFLRWSRRSQNAALEWQAFENRRCRQCGTHPDEWAENEFAYHAHLRRCPGCRDQQRLASSDDAKGDGVYAVMQPGPALECVRCKPLPIM